MSSKIKTLADLPPGCLLVWGGFHYVKIGAGSTVKSIFERKQTELLVEHLTWGKDQIVDGGGQCSFIPVQLFL